MLHPQTQSAGTGNTRSLVSRNARFERYQLTTLLSKELEGFLGVAILAFFALFVVITTLPSLVIIVSNGRFDICDRFWEPAIAVGIGLLLYTFHVWRTDHTSCGGRLTIQWLLWTTLAFGFCVCGFCAVNSFLATSVLHAGLVFLAFVVCNRFVPPKVNNGRDMLGFRTNEELARLAKDGDVNPLEVKREQKKRLLATAAIAFVFSMLFFVCVFAFAKLGERLAVSAMEIRYVGKMAPAFSFTTIDDDESWALADHRGKVVVLDDWTRRETNCGEQAALWKRLTKNDTHRGELVIATVSAEDKKSALRWREKHSATWPVLVSPYSHSIFRPVVFAGSQPVSVIDRNGLVTLITTDLERVESEIERLMSL